MTVNGESVTQKEILADCCFVVPGALQEDNLPATPNSQAAFDIQKKQPEHQVVQFNEFCIQYYAQPDAPAVNSRFCTSANFVLMQFCLSGNCSYSDESTRRSIGFKPAEYNLLCIPQKQELVFSCEAGKLDIVAIYLENSFLLKCLPPDHALAHRVTAKSLKTLTNNNLTINPRQQSVLHDIINCGFCGHLQKLYTQAKITELLALYLAQLEEEKSHTVSLKKCDIDKMMIVKDIIDNNISQSFSLSNLAKAVVTNEQYLKKHFKIVFGSTVFNYILCRRMEKAKEMLLNGEHKIAEVAEHTGYKHATHFTSAFKKYFGFLPHQLKALIFFLLSDYCCLEAVIA